MHVVYGLTVCTWELSKCEFRLVELECVVNATSVNELFFR